MPPQCIFREKGVKLLTWKTPLWPGILTLLAVLTLPNQASPLTPCFASCQSTGILLRSSQRVQPIVGPIVLLNFAVFIPSFPR
jgi:hypothetical protein